MALFSKKKDEPQDINQVLAQFKELQNQFAKLSADFDAIAKKDASNLQKVAMIRFNPFNETGGNQSFSVAILDGNDCGIVISSLFSRNENRVYGKPIKNGVSEFPLTDEEKEAIRLAQIIRQISNFAIICRLGLDIDLSFGF